MEGKKLELEADQLVGIYVAVDVVVTLDFALLAVVEIPLGEKNVECQAFHIIFLIIPESLVIMLLWNPCEHITLG